MYAIRSYYGVMNRLRTGLSRQPRHRRPIPRHVITSYSIHYTKLYDFIRSEGQYSEFQAGAHAALACVSCHNPHKPAEFSIKNECADCHSELAASYATSFKGEAGIQCEDCHMPYATLAALV